MFVCPVPDPKWRTEERPMTPFRGRKNYCLGKGRFWRRTSCVFYRDVNVQQTISVLWLPNW